MGLLSASGPRMARDALPRPVLKWAGGKRQLLPELLAQIDRAGPFGRYHEPFIGGAAVYFELSRLGRLAGGASIADVNVNLVEVYTAIRADVAGVIDRLEAHGAAHRANSEAHYYAVREHVPATLVDRAARVLYLNRTCFNGLYRENARGLFNVPFGAQGSPTICNRPLLEAAARALQPTEVRCAGFATVLDRAVAGDLVYLDPPYVPLSASSSFASYAKGGFGPADQAALAGVVGELDRRGVKVVLSNSMTARVRELYGALRITTVLASRRVNSRADRRGDVEEALVTNF